MYLVKKHLYVCSNNYKVSFLIEKHIKFLKHIKFITQFYLFIAFEFIFTLSLLLLSTFPVFLQSLNNYFFRWLAYKSLLAEIQRYNKLYCVSNLFLTSSYFPSFSKARFFRVQVFLGPGPGSRSRVWVQILEVDDAKQLY